MNAPDDQPAGASEEEDTLDRAARRQADRIALVLAEDGSRGWPRRMHPELREVLQRWHANVQEVSRLLDGRTSTLAGSTEERLRELLKADPGASRGIDYAWRIADSLKLMLPQIGDDNFIGGVLENERVRNAAGWRLSWTSYFDTEELRELEEAFRSGEPSSVSKARAIERIVSLWERRSDDGSHWRARQAMQSRYLQMSAALLGLLVPVFFIAASLSGNSEVSTILLVTVASALGSTLSGAFKIRDVVTMAALRPLGSWFVVQPLVGATAGLFLYLVLVSRLITLPGGTTPPALAVYGFLAGFSEPFFLGIVRRIAGSAEDQRGQQKSTRKP